MVWAVSGCRIVKAEQQGLTATALPLRLRRGYRHSASRLRRGYGTRHLGYVAGVGAGEMAGHAVNPSLGARGRHPWRPTVPPSHPHRHLESWPVSYWAQERISPGARRPDAFRIPEFRIPNPSIQIPNPPTPQPSIRQPVQATSKQCRAFDLRWAPTYCEVLAWVSLRGPEPHGGGSGAYRGEGALRRGTASPASERPAASGWAEAGRGAGFAACPANLLMPAPFQKPAHLI